MAKGYIHKYTALILVLLFLFCLPIFGQTKQRLQKQEHISSPNGNYTLIVNEYFESRDGLSYDFFLKDSLGQKKLGLYLGGVYQSSLWSPDSKYIVFNQHIVSNLDNSLLYSIEENDFTDIEKCVYTFIGEADREIIKDNDHIYIHATQWVNPTTLELYITGHGKSSLQADPGFTLIYQFNVEEFTFERLAYYPQEFAAE